MMHWDAFPIPVAGCGRARRPHRAGPAAHRDGSPCLCAPTFWILEFGFWIGRPVAGLRRELFLILVLAGVVNLVGAAEPISNELLYRQLAVGDQAVSTAALDRIVKNSDVISAAVLYSAVSVAVREKRVEDAAFLFYIARFRGQFDADLFPSVGKGGDSPLTALSALQQQWGSVINPVVMGNPPMFATVLARVKAWAPAVPEDYQPGWQYTGRGEEGRARAAMEGPRTQFLDSMGGLCTLLQDPAYFTAFRTGQDYNTLRNRSRPTMQAFQEAMQTMARIEKEKGIQGIAAQTQPKK